jgi:hypothetical protein
MVSDQGGTGNEGNAKQPSPAITEGDAATHRQIAESQSSISEKALVDRITRSDRWMIGLTAAIAFSGVLSAVIFWRQLNAMNGQLDEMKSSGLQTAETIKALNSQAETMHGQLAEMQKQSAMTQNLIAAKLGLSFGKTPQIEKNKRTISAMGITPQWRNVGSTDAIHVRNWEKMKAFTEEAPADFDFLTGKPNSELTITPGNEILQGTIYIDIKLLNAVTAGKEMIVFWGYTEYQDIFPDTKTHHVHWCVRVVPFVLAGEVQGFSTPFFRPECNSSD